MLKILSFRIKDNTTSNLLKEIIFSFTTVSDEKIGMPIGNLTSQIFANIYLNELDRFIKHTLRAKAYVRYGDDFILVEKTQEKLKLFRIKTIDFLENNLKLTINPKSDKIIKPAHGLKFLGVKIWPSGRTLNERSLKRATQRLNPSNISSYSGLIKKHCNKKYQKYFDWIVLEKLNFGRDYILYIVTSSDIEYNKNELNNNKRHG
ncbi:MAG: RNA-directed DNA polymerase [Candidatus Gracilibacteria bacterium]